MLRTITLLVLSNIFMTIAWYGFLRKRNSHNGKPFY
ncbi:MAG: DMT family protein [Chitinophagaceae bacterium]